MKMNNIFIFTICYNCGKILKKALETFFKFHPDAKVHVFGTAKDFKDIKEFSKNLEFIELSGDDILKGYYKNGHLGTAYIVSKVLKKEYGNYNKIIHFDSDVIFRDECLSDIITGFNEGYDLVGQRRSYEKNRCNRDDLKGIPDVIGTCFFGMNLEKLPDYNFETLHRMVVGYHNPHPHPTLDFFDPISFDILYRGGRIKYLNNNEYGASDENGSWVNDNPELNLLFDFGNKFIHFAGIGSGMNFYYNGDGSVPASYSVWAKERFSLYMKLFFDEDLTVAYNQETYDKIKPQL
jgi:hypothetical protein